MGVYNEPIFWTRVTDSESIQNPDTDYSMSEDGPIDEGDPISADDGL